MGKKNKEKRDADESLTEEQPTKKKIKSEPEESAADDTINGSQATSLIDLPYNDKLQYVSIIAQPMVTKKLAKKLFKLIKKASKVEKGHLRAGLRDVQMRIRKGETGLVVFAGDVTPVEVMCHLPSVCEEKNIPYGYVPLRADISAAMQVKRPCLMAMVRRHAEYADLFAECEEELKALPLPASA